MVEFKKKNNSVDLIMVKQKKVNVWKNKLVEENK